MATVALRPPLTPSNPCEHGVAGERPLLQEVRGPRHLPEDAEAEAVLQVRGRVLRLRALCAQGEQVPVPDRCKREGCRTKATHICEHGRYKYDCLKGDCPGSSLCKHGSLRAIRCARCLEEKCQPCESPQTAEEPLPKKTRVFYGSSSCPGNMWPMGPRRLEPLV